MALFFLQAGRPNPLRQIQPGQIKKFQLRKQIPISGEKTKEEKTLTSCFLFLSRFLSKCFSVLQNSRKRNFEFQFQKQE